MALLWTAAVCAALGAAGAEAAGEGQLPKAAPGDRQPAAPDASAVLDRLIERYRGLEAYRDSAEVVCVTEREGEAPHRVETRIACEIDGGRLKVHTPGSQIRDAVGVEAPVAPSPAMEALVRRYRLWIAPHMALRFTEDPRREFRLGVGEGFTATKAEPVEEAGRSLIRLELRSGDGLSESCTARFDLFVDPSTMLVERVEGQQRLPDGAQYRTTLRIAPERAEPSAPERG